MSSKQVSQYCIHTEVSQLNIQTTWLYKNMENQLIIILPNFHIILLAMAYFQLHSTMSELSVWCDSEKTMLISSHQYIPHISGTKCKNVPLAD